MDEILNFIKKNGKLVDRNTHIRLIVSDITSNISINKTSFEQKIKQFDQKGYKKDNINYVEYNYMNKILKKTGHIEQCYTIIPIANIEKIIGFKKIIAICERYNYISSEEFSNKRNYESIKNSCQTSYNVENLYSLIFTHYDKYSLCSLCINKQNIFEDMYYNSIGNTLNILLD